MSALQAAISEIRAGDHQTTNIKGRQYTTVATRVEIFRKHFGSDASLETEMIAAPDPYVRVRAIIRDAEGRVLATGMAEENRELGNINKTSALENCETSAVGRALAALGLHGGEYASAGEVQNAIAQQEAPRKNPPGITAFRTEAHEFVRELHSCVDYSAYEAFVGSPESRAFLQKAKDKFPDDFYGNDGDIIGLKGEMQKVVNQLKLEEVALCH